MWSSWGTDVRRAVGLLVRRDAAIRRDADEELESLLDERVQYFVARGMSTAAARDEAVRRLGGTVDQARERLRNSAVHRERLLSIRESLREFATDVQYAARGLVRAPLFSGFAVVTLALGIGSSDHYEVECTHGLAIGFVEGLQILLNSESQPIARKPECSAVITAILRALKRQLSARRNQ
jgi:hypothetical protein